MGRAKGDCFLGMAFRRLDAERYELDWCLVERSGDELELSSYKKVAGSLQQVLENVPKGYPVCVALAGKGILHRLVASVDAQQAVEVAFPGVHDGEFYRQLCVFGRRLQVSLCRRVVVELLLDRLQRSGLSVYSLSLGGLPLLQFRHFLKRDSMLHIDGYAFGFDEDGNSASYREDWVSRSMDTLTVGGEELVAGCALPYGLVLQFVSASHLVAIEASVPELESRKHRYWQRAAGKKKLLWVLGAVFLLLLVNFLVQSYLNEQNGLLLAKVGVQDSGEEELAVMRDDVKHMEQLLGLLHWNDGYNYGFLTHELGQSLPRSLELSELAFNKQAEDKPMVMPFTPKIAIKGQTANLMAVNNWLSVLKNKKWVRSASLQRCVEDRESGAFDFEILITY